MKNLVYYLLIGLISITFYSLSSCKESADNINIAPTEPAQPAPGNNANEVILATSLVWECSDPDGDKLVYDVYFGTNANPDLVAEGVATRSYYYGKPDYNTTYYWKVVARDENNNETAGPIWSFTTVEEGGVNIIEEDFELGSTGVFITMVWIEPGNFMMGAQSGETGAQGDEYPRHLVTISEGFWMAKYETTQEQWEAVAGNWNFHFNNNPNRPAETISWDRVHSHFLNPINSQEIDTSWRLPSAAEWEYACRAGYDETRFWWGNDPRYNQIVYYAWCWENNDTGNGHETHDVGLKLPNPWGLYDINGNVWEWCEDNYHFNYSNAPTDGSAWVDTDDNGKVARGGGWGQYGAQFCRSSARGRDNPSTRSNIFGFRLVRDGG
jgi:formylglycine-generating enzyme required for sulfatase activity